METFPLTARLEAPCFSFASTPPEIPGPLHPEARGSPSWGRGQIPEPPGTAAPAAAPVALAHGCDAFGGLGSGSRGWHSRWWQQARGCGFGGSGMQVFLGAQGCRIWGAASRSAASAPRPCAVFRLQPLPCPLQELIAALGTPKPSSFPTSISRRQNRSKMGARAAGTSGVVAAA